MVMGIEMAQRRIFVMACCLLMLGIILGAFAAHGLKAQLSVTHLAVFQTGVTYQMYHGLGLLALSVCAFCQPQRLWLAARVLLMGVVIFSGSLYLLVLLQIPKLGMVTPIGGILMIVGWGIAVWASRGSTVE